MKITLIEPTRYLENGELLKAKRLFFPALTLPRLASLLPPESDISIVIEVLEKINFDEKTDLVGITSYTTNIHRAYKIANEFRRRKVPVVMGGIHVSMEPEEALEHADTIIIGEAEETWPQFISDFRNGIRKKVYEAKDKPSLANLPLPRFSLLNNKGYSGYPNKNFSRFFLNPLIPIETARGCLHTCDYCSIAKFYRGEYRTRPIADVVNEIKTLKAKACFFIDDNIFANPPRTKELLKALIPLKISWRGQATINAAEDREFLQLAQRSGCSGLSIGLESLSHTSLASVGKDINKVEHYERNLKNYSRSGIGIAANMIFGFDDEETGVFKEAYDFLIKNRVPYTSWWPLIPFPGTSFYSRLKEQGRLKDDKWWLNPYDKAHFLKFTRTKMEEGIFCKDFRHYYRRFYSWGSIMKRILLPPQQGFLLKTIANLVFKKKLAGEPQILNINL